MPKPRTGSVTLRDSRMITGTTKNRASRTNAGRVAAKLPGRKGIRTFVFGLSVSSVSETMPKPPRR
ncbi:hypothetical protein D3C71_1996590 [compost metagenome]